MANHRGSDCRDDVVVQPALEECESAPQSFWIQPKRVRSCRWEHAFLHYTVAHEWALSADQAAGDEKATAPTPVAAASNSRCVATFSRNDRRNASSVMLSAYWCSSRRAVCKTVVARGSWVVSRTR